MSEPARRAPLPRPKRNGGRPSGVSLSIAGLVAVAVAVVSLGVDFEEARIELTSDPMGVPVSLESPGRERERLGVTPVILRIPKSEDLLHFRFQFEAGEVTRTVQARSDTLRTHAQAPEGG